MKAITEKQGRTAADAWGRDQYVYYQDFEIEEVDVGLTRHHYQGMNYASVQFRRSHVGQIITVMTDGKGWTCWSFKRGSA